MKVLVTGAAGFLGSHLTEKLIESGYSVRALMHYDSNNNWGWLENSKYRKEIDFVVGDIRDFDSVHSAMKDIDEVKDSKTTNVTNNSLFVRSTSDLQKMLKDTMKKNK